MIQAQTWTPKPSRSSSLAALALMIPAPTIGALVSLWIALGSVGLAVYGLCKAILYLTPALWCRFVDHESWRVSTSNGKSWLMGLMSGVVVGGVIFAASWLLGPEVIDVAAIRRLLQDNGLSGAPRFFAVALWICLVNSLLEEYAFRWFITTRIEVLTARGATVLSALAFTLHHVIVLLKILPEMAWLASLGVFCAGLVWAGLYRRCGSIGPCWLSHALLDASILWIGWQAVRLA